jgi:transglutaminase-like putative cysteine protease
MSEADLPSSRLRTLATDHIRSGRWAELAALEPALRADTEYWSSWWAAACAIGRWHEGRADARDLLEECIAAGFHDMEPFGRLFEDSFGTEPDWPTLYARIEANAPLPPVALVRWPCSRLTLPLGLSRLDAAGAARLAARLPQPQASALATAEMLLGWVTDRWRHSGGSHAPSNDANVVLDRVERGERFACVEYTGVLTQALNAMEIPARPISLFRLDYFAGLGTGHVVTDAWIDDLGKWVVLDGQNGAVWRDAAGTPLGVLELQQRYLIGDQPEFSGHGQNFDPDDAAAWFRYFYAASVTGILAWSPGPYVPVMEGAGVIASQRLTESLAGVAPDLAEISTGVADDEGPALAFQADHPYATGFLVTNASDQATVLDPGQPFRLAGGEGAHELTVAATTRYGTLTPQPLEYVVNKPGSGGPG